MQSDTVKAIVRGMADDKDPLLPDIENALALHQISQTRFGYIAVGDPALVKRLREGMVMREDRRGKVEAALRKLEAEGGL